MKKLSIPALGCSPPFIFALAQTCRKPKCAYPGVFQVQMCLLTVGLPTESLPKKEAKVPKWFIRPDRLKYAKLLWFRPFHSKNAKKTQY